MQSHECEDAEEEFQSFNLTTINDDCREHIFTFLNWEDLLNLAETCKQLSKAARDFFSRKYKNACICFGDIR